jgi:hypothetical protein
MIEIPEFRDTGKRMLLAWREEVHGPRDRRACSVGNWPADKLFDGISDSPRFESPRSVVGRSSVLGHIENRIQELKIGQAYIAPFYLRLSLIRAYCSSVISICL